MDGQADLERIDQQELEDYDEAYYSDLSAQASGHEQPERSPESGLNSPTDYSPHTPPISEEMKAQMIVRFREEDLSTVSSTPMEQEAMWTEALLEETAERLRRISGESRPETGEVMEGVETGAEGNIPSTSTSTTQNRKNKPIKEEGISIPEITNGTFLSMREELNRIWGYIVKENFCEGGHMCEIPEHVRMGPLSPMHSNIPPNVRYELCYALTLALTSAEDKLRFCLPCRACNKMVAGDLPTMMTHVMEHGQEIHENYDLTVIGSNLRILKHLNGSYVLTCPILGCKFNTKSEEEAYLHHTISHETISTKCMLMCIFCSEPLMGKSLEEHVRSKNENGPQDVYHDLNCCGLTIATIGSWLAHRLNEHTIDFLANLSEQTRIRMALAMYSNAACVAWATSVPVMVLTEE